jgi:hypothetical protein
LLLQNNHATKGRSAGVLGVWVSVRVLVAGLRFLDRRSPYGQFRVSWGWGGRGHRG